MGPQFEILGLIFSNLVQESLSPGPPGLIPLKLVQEIPLAPPSAAPQGASRPGEWDFLNQFLKIQPQWTWGGASRGLKTHGF